MTAPRPRVLALVGATAAGKTELALAVARATGAEIVNADSRQVYRGLDIGSAKPTPAERAAVPHHVLDVVDPDASFNAADFHRLATAAIAAIARRGRPALVVGGTGLYVKVLRGGLFAGPPRDPRLRAELEALERNESGALHRRLAAVDPETAARLHANDVIRLVRALEVHERTGRSISELQREHAFGARVFEVRTIAVDVARAELYRRIDARCDAMIAAGLVDEVRGLLAAGHAPELPSLSSVGYRQIAAFLRGAGSLDEARAAMAQATRNLAKRQLTWFRNDPEVAWRPPEAVALLREARAWWAATE